MVDGQPLTGSPNNSVRTTITKIITKAMNENRIPKTEAICRGSTLKAVIPSSEYLNNFQNDHFVSPATRSTFSNSIHFVLLDRLRSSVKLSCNQLFLDVFKVVDHTLPGLVSTAD